MSLFRPSVSRTDASFVRPYIKSGEWNPAYLNMTPNKEVTFKVYYSCKCHSDNLVWLVNRNASLHAEPLLNQHETLIILWVAVAPHTADSAGCSCICTDISSVWYNAHNLYFSGSCTAANSSVEKYDLQFVRSSTLFLFTVPDCGWSLLAVTYGVMGLQVH